MSVAQYLERYAEPEAALASRVEGVFQAALVVPAHAESPDFVDAFRAAGNGRLLVIAVINSSLSSPVEARGSTRELLRVLTSGATRLSASGTPMFRRELGAFTLLVVDRTSEGFELPEKQGVGLSRKLGADLALALFSQEKLELPYLLSSDADTELPEDYLASAHSQASQGSRAAALLYPFRHVPAGAAEVDEATLAYEASLRYHVLGLRAAGSPYAFHSVGSTLAIDAESYAKVRGFPKRLAGEDFYLLDKLAKIGAIALLQSEPLRIRSRVSQRVPFGTGPRVQKIVEEGGAAGMLVYHPDVYRVLGEVLSGFEAAAKGRDPGILRERLQGLPDALGVVALSALEELGFLEELERAIPEVPREDVLVRRWHTFFDSLKTVRFIHALRDRGRENIGLGRALSLAPFLGDDLSELGLGAVCEALRAREMRDGSARGLGSGSRGTGRTQAPSR